MNYTASKILMVRPDHFGFNPQTAASNAFQKMPELSAGEVSKRARSEFDQMVRELELLDVDVVVVSELDGGKTPDAVFPNNVFSTHPDGTVCFYPMEAEARRLERGIAGTVLGLKSVNPRVLDFSHFEDEGKFLEGTGSLVLDHANKIAYASVSSRTHPELVDKWCEEMGFEGLVFESIDESGQAIYHTNVMMCIGSRFAVACVDSISSEAKRNEFVNRIENTGRELVEISYEQMNAFAGNMIEIESRDGSPVLAMSRTASESLNENQLDSLRKYCTIASFDIGVIESCGGGSVRCMIAEIF